MTLLKHDLATVWKMNCERRMGGNLEANGLQTDNPELVSIWPHKILPFSMDDMCGSHTGVLRGFD